MPPKKNLKLSPLSKRPKPQKNPEKTIGSNHILILGEANFWIMESLNTFNNNVPIKVYILATIFCILAVVAVVPSVNNFRENRGCEAYLDLAKQYNFTPSSCSQYSFQKYIVPAVAMALPFLFIVFVLLLKEKKKEYRLTKQKQEKIAFWLSVFAVLTFLLSFVLITHLTHLLKIPDTTTILP